MSFEKWEVKKIQDIGKVVGGGTPSTKKPEYYGGDIPWITPRDLSGYTRRVITGGERSITQKGFDNSSARLLPKGTVLFSSRAPIGYVAIAGCELTTNQGFKSIVCNPDVVDNVFMYYKMKTQKEALESVAGGSTFKEVSGRVVKNFEVLLPPLGEQKKIAKLLSSLDDKIELNNQINETLEEMAQAIFKHWFVDFEFPNENGEPYKSSGGKFVESELGMIPEGWKIGTFRDFTNKIVGGDWGKVSPQGNYTKKVHCIRGADIPEVTKGNDGAPPKRYILEKNHKNKRLEQGDIVVEISGGSPTQSTGRITYITDELLSKFPTDLVCTNFCRAVTLKKKNYMEFFYYGWKRLYENKIFFQFENGTTGIKNLDINSFLDNYQIVIPGEKYLNVYHKAISILLKKIQENGRQNNQLGSLRDTLLPKLMSGEISIPDAEQEVEKCLQKTN